MGRTATKQAIASFLSTIPGIKRAYDYSPKNIDGKEMPCVVISLPDEDETRATMTAPIGRRRNEVSVRLRVMDIDPSKDERSGEVAFDALVDAVKQAIRERPDLDGAVLVSAQRYVRTNVPEPRLAGKDGGSLFRMAQIEFDVLEHVVG